MPDLEVTQPRGLGRSVGANDDYGRRMFRCYDCGHQWPTELEPDWQACPRCIRSIERLGVAGLVSMSDLMRTTFPDLAWHVPALFPEGFSLLVGAPKAGKSWLALAMAMALGGGGDLFGDPCEVRPVLYLALEDSLRRLKTRAIALGCSLDGAPMLDVLTTIPPEQSASSVMRSWTEALPLESAAPLVIIDTLGRVRGSRRPSESPYDHDYRLGAAVKAAADAIDGGAVIALHHDRKAGSADFVDDVSGTNGLAGSADTIVVLRRDRESAEGVLMVTGRDVDEASYGMAFDRGHWERQGDDWTEARSAASAIAAKTGRGDLASKIVAYLQANDGATPKHIADGLGEHYNAVKQSLYRMRSQGVALSDGGRYHLPIQSP